MLALVIVGSLIYGGTARCVLDFKWQWHAGIDDSTWKISLVTDAARAFGCETVVPAPHVMLAPNHNNNIRIDETVWWDRYYDTPPICNDLR